MGNHHDRVLLDELNSRTAEAIRKRRTWPKTPKALANALDRLAPNLRAIGLDVKRLKREPGTGRRMLRLEKVEAPPSRTSPSSQAAEAEDRGPSDRLESSQTSPGDPRATDRGQEAYEFCEGCEDREDSRPPEAGDVGGDLFQDEV